MSIVKKLAAGAAIVKKLVAGAAIAMGSLSVAFAQEGGSLTVDTSTAESAVDAIGSAISGLISGKITENIFLVLGAGLVIAFLFMGVRWMLRGGKVAAK